jgi:hypothetical protein
MPSVFDYLGINTQSAFTRVPRLGIKSHINQLQFRADQDYYTIEENAVAADKNVLAVKIKKGQGFNLRTYEHTNHLHTCTELFKEKSKALKALDYKIATSVVVGIIASSLSFIPFVGYFSLLGWGAALYFINQRSKAHEEYRESLHLLIGACNWSLGPDAKNRQSAKEELTNNAVIREMMAALYPVLTETQARHLIADDIEDIFAEELRNYEGKYQLTKNPSAFFGKADGDESIARSKRSAQFNRCIYGFNKGGATDFMDAFLSVFPDIYNAIHYGFKVIQHWFQSKGKAPEESALKQQNA